MERLAKIIIKNMQTTADILNKKMKENIANSDKEPSIFVKPPKEVAKTEAPMQLNGTPTLEPTQPTMGQLKVDYTDYEGGKKVKRSRVLTMHRLTSSQRETAVRVLVDMLKRHDLLGENMEFRGFDSGKLYNMMISNGKPGHIGVDGLRAEMNENYELQNTIFDYIRLLGEIVTDADAEFLKKLNMADATAVFGWICDNEHGIIRDAVDFLGMPENPIA